MNDLKSITGFSGNSNALSGTRQQLAASGNRGEQSTIPVEQFESTFYSMMIKQMRQSMSENGLFPGEQTDSYGSLFDMFMGQHLADAQPLGIARMVARYQEAGVAS